MEIYKKQSLSEAFKVYFDKRMIKILLLGAISGFPWVIIGSSLSLWLKEDGLSRSTIGWAGLIFAVYAFNYLWAPLIDRIKKHCGNEVKFETTDDYGVDGDFVESQAFAFLAIRSFLKLPISFPNTTGCKLPSTGGVLVKNF